MHTVAQPLTGKTLGILGLGAIGQEVARIAAALGMRVIGTKRRPGADGATSPRCCRPSAPTRCWRNPTSCCCCCRRRPTTDNFINAERLAKMKPTAWLLNFGRGHLIKDDDLIAAVKAKKIAGAAARRLPPGAAAAGASVLDRPRASSCCRISAARIRSATASSPSLFVDNLGRFLDGAPLKEVVDRTAGY